jgi:hypothetical protein
MFRKLAESVGYVYLIYTRGSSSLLQLLAIPTEPNAFQAQFRDPTNASSHDLMLINRKKKRHTIILSNQHHTSRPVKSLFPRSSPRQRYTLCDPARPLARERGPAKMNIKAKSKGDGKTRKFRVRDGIWVGKNS